MQTDNEKYNKTVQPNTSFLNYLKYKLPEFFTKDGFFDMNKFQSELEKKNINELNEGYQLDFIGKDYARRQAGEMPKTVIVPDEKQNKGEGKDSKNLFFTGDNLEVLHHLEVGYLNKINTIFIDPPYNTGSNEFEYPDSFEYSDDRIKKMFSLEDEQVEKLKSIQGSSSHSAWLTFMYPRLVIAKRILSSKGTIFISIDDNEFSNLKNICDEIFGESNYVDAFVWESRTSISNDSPISLNHNYILVYAKDIQQLQWYGDPLNSKEYKNPDNDPRGPWKLTPLDANKAGGDTVFGITNPNTGKKYFPPNNRIWSFNRDGIKRLMDDGRIKFGMHDDSSPKRKLFLQERISKGDSKTPSSILKDVGTTKDGTNEIIDLFKSKCFSYPKPTSLLKRLIKYTSKDSEVIMDFFAGSATTADAVMQLNAEDGGHRQFIMVQISEKTYEVDKETGLPKLNKNGNKIPTKGSKAAYAAGFKSIDEIARERIRRAAKKIKKDNELTLPADFDGSFKHYRVVKPVKQTLEEIDDFDPNSTNLFTDMVNGFSSKSLGIEGNATGEETIMTTWLVKDGYQLNVDVEEVKFDNYTAYKIENNRLYLIKEGWGAEQTKELLNQLGTHQLEVQSVVVFGYSFNVAELRELENVLKLLDNKVTLIKRY